SPATSGRPRGGQRLAGTFRRARTTPSMPSSTTAPCGAAPSRCAGCPDATLGVVTGGIPFLKESTTDARRSVPADLRHPQLLLYAHPELRSRHRTTDVRGDADHDAAHPQGHAVDDRDAAVAATDPPVAGRDEGR